MSNNHHFDNIIDKAALWAFWAYIFILPFKSFLSPLHSPLRSVLMAVMFIFVLRTLFFRKTIDRYKYPFDFPLIALAIVTVVSTPFSFDPNYSASCLFNTLFPMLILYFVGSRLVLQDKLIERTALIVVLSSVLVVALCFASMDFFSGRLEGIFKWPTRYGKYLDLVIPVTIALLWIQKDLVKKLAIGCVSLAQVISLLCSGTRGSLVGLGIVTLPVIIINRKLIYVFVALIISGTVFLWFSPKALVSKERIAKLIRSPIDVVKKDPAMKSRFKIYQSIILLIKERPVLGWGYGNHIAKKILEKRGYDWLKKKGISPPIIYHSHNLLLEITLECGLLALIPALWLGWILLTACFKQLLFLPEKDPLAIGFFLGLMALGIHSIVTVPQWINSNLAMAYMGVVAAKAFGRYSGSK